MRTSSRSVAVLLFDEIELLDVAAMLAVLSSAGRKWNWRPFKVTTVAAAAGRVTTRSQIAIEAEQPLAACTDPELLILPGGYGARRALADESIVDWVRTAGSGAELTLAVGHGALLAAKAGLADGRELAIPLDSRELLDEVAPQARPAVDAPGVVGSEKLLSAAFSALALDLALTAVARVLGKRQAEGVAAALGHQTAAADSPLVIKLEQGS